jgi:hypothetical protein
MRVNAVGLRGKYKCDRCKEYAPRGVYTGVNGFVHTCPPCVVVIAQNMGFRTGKDVSGQPSAAQHFILTHQGTL